MLPKLYFADGDYLEPVPDWGTFFAELGSSLAKHNIERDRLIAAIALPTRAYAAALTAFGIVFARTAEPPEGISAGEHFQDLCRLQLDTPVTLVKNNRKRTGRLKGYMKSGDQEFIGVQVEDEKGGGLVEYVRSKDSLRVQISETEVTKLPRTQVGRKVVAHEGFLTSLLGRENASRVALSSRLDCEIIGRIGLFGIETKRTQFSLQPNCLPSEMGTLQDLLRVRQFLGENDSYRSEIIKAVGMMEPSVSTKENPHVVVFDGSAGFLKWRNNRRRSHWIVILDRSETNFQDAVQAINGEYMGREPDQASPKELPRTPPGVELLIYRERVK